MAEISKELLEKLMKASSPEEAMETLKAEGVTDAPPTDEVWQRLEALRAKAAQELSLDELSDVAGGGSATSYDWWAVGCMATVEPDSNCWGTDGGCCEVHYFYWNQPSTYCPKCGRPARAGHEKYYYCRVCGTFQWLGVNPYDDRRGGTSGSW